VLSTADEQIPKFHLQILGTLDAGTEALDTHAKGAAMEEQAKLLIWKDQYVQCPAIR